MSRSAGQVLIMPKGEYSATTQYYMLDLVEYNGCGYVAKQATKGNLPTNDTYWQQMGTTGGGGDPSTYMLIDGSNATLLNFADSQSHFIDHVDITKSAGENQTVSMVVNVKYNSQKGKQTELIRGELQAHVGDENVSFNVVVDGVNTNIYVVIDSVSYGSISYDTDDDTLNVSAHLKIDSTEAMSFTDKSLSLSEYVADGVERGLTFGAGNTLENNLSFAGGRQSTAGTRGFAFGDRCFAGSYAHAEGQETYAGLKSHAEGRYTVATSEGSHAEGTGTIADYTNQHAQGKWNYPRYGVAFMIGNGTPDDRSNCFEVYEDGSISFDNGTTKYRFGKVDGRAGYYDKNNTFHAFDPLVLERSNVTLSTATQTTVTFTNSAITANSRLQVYTDTFGVDPIDVSATAGSCTITFDTVESSTTIKVQLVVD